MTTPGGSSKLVDVGPLIEKRPWVGDLAIFNMLIYGEPGEGKTPLIATVVDVPEMMPALLIDCDMGTLSIRKVEGLHTIHLATYASTKGILHWTALEQIYAWLCLGDHEYKTVILDGGTDLMRYCELACIAVGVARKADGDKTHDPELAELADYRRMYERMKRTYMKFRELTTKDKRRLNFIATAHEGKLKDERTGALTIQPLFIGKSAVMITSVFDIVARLASVGDTPSKPTAAIKATSASGNEKNTKYLVPSISGRARGRDRTGTLGVRIANPTMKVIYERISKGEMTT